MDIQRMPFRLYFRAADVIEMKTAGNSIGWTCDARDTLRVSLSKQKRGADTKTINGFLQINDLDCIRQQNLGGGILRVTNSGDTAQKQVTDGPKNLAIT